MTVYTQLDELTTSHDNIRAKLVEKGVLSASTHGFTQFTGDIETLADNYDTEIADIEADYEDQIDALEDKIENLKIVVDGTVSGDYINNDVDAIGSHVFQGNTSITGISSDSVTVVKSYAFYGCTGITDILFPNVETVQSYAFYGCTGLTVVSLPSVEAIQSNSFRNCSSITEVDMPSISTIASTSFQDCTSLITFDVSDPERTTLPTLNNVNAFSGTPIESGTGYIYYNDDKVDELKAANNWSTYASQIKPVSEKPV